MYRGVSSSIFHYEDGSIACGDPENLLDISPIKKVQYFSNDISFLEDINERHYLLDTYACKTIDITDRLRSEPILETIISCEDFVVRTETGISFFAVTKFNVTLRHRHICQSDKVIGYNKSDVVYTHGTHVFLYKIRKRELFPLNIDSTSGVKQLYGNIISGLPYSYDSLLLMNDGRLYSISGRECRLVDLEPIHHIIRIQFGFLDEMVVTVEKSGRLQDYAKGSKIEYEIQEIPQTTNDTYLSMTTLYRLLTHRYETNCQCQTPEEWKSIYLKFNHSCVSKAIPLFLMTADGDAYYLPLHGFTEPTKIAIPKRLYGAIRMGPKSARKT